MTPRQISAVLVAITVPVGVWTFAEAHAGPAQEQTQQQPKAKPTAPKESAQTKDALARDIDEWMTAWNRLDEQQREVLLMAGKRVVTEVEGLTPEQKASVIRGLDALAADTSMDYQELPEKRREAVKGAISELRGAYLDLSAEQKTRFLTELAGSLDELRQHEAQQQPMGAPISPQ